MRKMMNKVAGNMKVTAAKTAMLLKDKKGENYVDTAVKILIAVVIGALLLAGLQDFDEEVHRYYDLRNTERPVDPFSDQIASNAVDSGVTSKAVAPNAKRQGFRLER